MGKTGSLALLAKIGVQREFREALLKIAKLDITQPSIIRIAVTDRCNYRCAYCDHWRQESYKDELSATQWRKVIFNLKRLAGSSIIQFTGGEPFLRRDFLDIAKHAEGEGFRWGVITNGYRLNEHTCDAICERSPMNVDISIDSARAEIHDKARGVPGSFASIASGVKLLNKVRSERGGSFKIRLKATVHKLNIPRLKDMVSLTHKLGADSVDFSPIRVEGVINRSWLLPSVQQLNDLEEIVDELCRMKREGAPIETTEAKLRSMSDHFAEKKVIHGTAKCKAPVRDLYVDPAGEARFCWNYESLGNLYENSLDRVWNSRSSRSVRHGALDCSKFGTSYCATSCLNHRKFSDNVKRALQHAGI